MSRAFKGANCKLQVVFAEPEISLARWGSLDSKPAVNRQPGYRGEDSWAEKKQKQ